MNACLEQAKQTAAFLNEALPDLYEILVFDLSEKELPLAAKHRVKRSHPDALRKYLRIIFKSERVLQAGRLTRRGDVLQDKLHKVSVQLFQNAEGQPGAALILIQEITALMTLQGTLNSLLCLDNTDLEELSHAEEEPEQELSLETIDRMVESFTDEPERLTPDEKTELLIDLYDTGVFELKSAVSHAAFVLSMSEQSVYRYLAKIRRSRGE